MLLMCVEDMYWRLGVGHGGVLTSGNGGATVEEVGCVIASTKKSVAVEGEGDECLAQVDQELAKRFFASKQQELYWKLKLSQNIIGFFFPPQVALRA